MTCNGPDPPGACPAREGDPDRELADEVSRRQTFSTFPSDCPVSPSALAQAGFFYAGEGDQVTCFRCHVTVGAWRRGDSAAERHEAASPDCPFVKAVDSSGGTGRPSLRSHNLHGADNGLEAHAPQPAPEHSSSELRADYLLRSHQVVDLSGSPYPRNAAMCDEEARLRSFQNWPPYAPVAPRELANAGLYYTGTDDEVECFCCGGKLRNWEPCDRAWSEHRRHFPRCFFVLGREVGNVGIAPNQSGDAHLDRGSLPQNPAMADYEARVETFATWNYLLNREDLARAGFYSLGNGDSVVCFHCGGGLQEWKAHEDPWEQHAKWFPGCKYLIEEKGQVFINSIHLTQSLLESTIEEAEKTTLTEDKDLLRNQVVQNAVRMGFSLDEIRKAMERKRHLSAESYGSIEALVGDLINAQQENTPHESWENELSMEEKLRRLQEEKLCKICMDQTISVVLLPCGHLVACYDCARAVDRCPLCCTEITQRQKIYTS